MSNSLDEPDGSFLVLMNHEAQYSLWPEFAEIPDGWTVAHPKSDRQTCLDYIEQQWTDMRPKSLVNDMTRDAA
ncbi:MbtH family protein [Streptomyces platensis]|uniref:MbtH family protein n=1 Tax=Streptomyces platensis TaxID=58346 RepID=UPI0036800E76